MEESSPTKTELDSPGIGGSRSRRERNGSVAKKSRFDALKKLKETRLSGKKNSYELGEVDNVYDLVEEKEYAKRVKERRQEDWIVDDDGNYVEDGRELFDEEEEEESAGKMSKTHSSKKKKVFHKSSNKSIKNMFLSMPQAKEKSVANFGNLDEDEILGELLNEVKKTPGSTPEVSLLPAPKRFKSSENSTPTSSPQSLNPFRRKGTGIKRPKSSVTTPKTNAKLDLLESEETIESPSQKVEEFDEEVPMDFTPFDDDIVDDNHIEEVKSQEIKIKEEVEEEEKDNRGFLSEMSNKENINAPSFGNWGNKSEEDSTFSASVVIENSQLPFETLPSGEKVLKIYWLDAYEDIYKHPGTVWLFGKVYIKSLNTFASCCITVKNIPRRVFLLKRDLFKDSMDSVPTTGDVYKEFEARVASRFKISEYKSKPVSKLYAFEIPGVPHEGEYLEVVYSAKYSAVTPDLIGNSFSRVFGSNQGFLEHFLISRKIKGPCWLEIKKFNSSGPPISWCKFEAFVESPSFISVISSNGQQIPAVTVMSLNMKTVINPKSLQNEIVSLSAVVQQDFALEKSMKAMPSSHFVALTRPVDVVWPFDIQKKLNASFKSSVTKMDSERALLAFILAKIVKIDPDFIIGYDMAGFDLDVLFHRTIKNKIPHWSRLGRLRRSATINFNAFKKTEAYAGRIIADLKISAKELIRCKSYEIASLFEKILGHSISGRTEYDSIEVHKSYEDSEGIVKFVVSSLNDASYVLQCICELNVVPLAMQITQIAGNVLSRTLLGGRAERNEFLLLHAFSEKNYIVPDKSFSNKKNRGNHDLGDESSIPVKAGRKKPSYAGGLVLEPKRGFYDKYILLMDFNSLYPSIIQEYNICFTTVERKKVVNEEYIPELPRDDAAVGILPTEIRKLVESRRAVKTLLKDPNSTPEQKSQYDIRQKALKLTANSMYGCLGFSHSRFHAKPLAALITSRGREILLQTRDLVEKNLNLEVIYGDTDSIMINSNSKDFDEVFRLGAKIKSEVNRLYKLLELDVDGVFRYMLLLKKKKYAAITVEKKNGEYIYTTELKGLDIVRRDWCQLSSDTGKYILENIMKDISEDERIALIHRKLELITEDLQNGRVTLAQLAITKQLTKDPTDYADTKALPHVQVALRMNSVVGGKRLKSGDTVPYVICLDGTDRPATQRGFHIDEVANENSNLKVDTKYYLSQQLHPVLSRICDPLDGTDSSRIAQCLGLDPDQFKKIIRSTESNEERELISEVDKFRPCNKLKIKCVCGEIITLESIVTGSPSSRDFHLSLTQCPKPDCGHIPLSQVNVIKNKLVQEIRRHIKEYYSGWIICEDPACSGRTRQLPIRFQQSFPVCSTCEKATMYREYSDVSLYTQLLYYSKLFDLKSARETFNSRRPDIQLDLSRVRGGEEKYQVLFDTVKKILNLNNYSIVSLSKVFDGLLPFTAEKLRNRRGNTSSMYSSQSF
ncbi:DNA polymerase alpha catalytic subunit [Lepeophtheirus salmonis]|uniref:DNA polymerase alpha catalytic subunit n=1 Tax=Lepeophtheirus salmonis TaxID=72036 RepID=UPI001AE87E92|nr:DNA polymerase alpha catalytic subunit-like [Lepeophtheirus salmonis]